MSWTPIGGPPTTSDRAPTLLFLFAYILLLSPFIKRQYDPVTRTLTLGLFTALFVLGRVFLLTFRLLGISNHPSPSSSSNSSESGTESEQDEESRKNGMDVFEQIGLAVGYMGIMLDLIAFARAVLVNATLEDPTRGSKDRKTLRTRIRRVMWYPACVFGVLSTFGSLEYVWGIQSGRYITDIGGLTTLIAFASGLLYIRNRIPYIDLPALDAIIKLTLTLTIIPLYRIPSLSPHDPPPKTFFYLLHLLPELLVASYIHCTNLRGKFNTGPYGDYGDSVPRLREDGVFVQGVGVEGEEEQEVRRGVRWWLRFLFWPFERRPRKATGDEEEFDPDKESLLTLVATR